MGTRVYAQNLIPNGLKRYSFQDKENKNDGIASVLNFRPNLELLHRATRHRLGSAISCHSRCPSAKVKTYKCMLHLVYDIMLLSN